MIGCIESDRAISAHPSVPASPRNALWRGAGAVALFVTTAAICLTLITPGFDACRRAFGHDFLAFYAAGTLVREGRASELYNLDTVRRVEQATARAAGFDLGDSVGPWWNPPVFAGAFVPLSALPYEQALAAWTAINLAAAAAAFWMLARLVAPSAGPDRWLAVLLLAVCAPFLQSVVHGQNSAISLLLVTVAVTAWRARRTFVASACIGLLLYKPQLAAALAVVLVLHRGWRAGAGLAYVGCVLCALAVETMPGALTDYLHRLPQNLHAIQVEHAYLWERHVTLKAFWRLLLQGRGPGEASHLAIVLTVACAVPLVSGLLVAALRARSRRDTDALVAATLASAPLLMPFYFDYDLLLLAAAAALAVKSGARSLRLWAALYLWLFVNPYVAGAIRINLTVPLLLTLALTLIDRALHGQTEDSGEVTTDVFTALARAA